MERGRRRGLWLAGAAVLAAGAAWPPLSADSMEKAPAPLILSAQADTERATLTIRGRGLGSSSAPPKVTLAGEAVAVNAANGETVVVALPLGTAAGSHLLEVRDARGTLLDRFTATIPTNEVVTPAGIRIESSESDVLIVAGDSRITVDPAGGVTIEGAGAVSVRAGTSLSLRGQTVTVRSDTSLSLIAPVINLN
jgi:hypothetical protein